MGSNNTPGDAHPRFGFHEDRLFNGSLTTASPTGPSLDRMAGLRQVICMGIFTLAGGAGSVGLIIEGSNDGVNWFVLSNTAPTELFTTNGQVQILNEIGSGLVDLEHWDRVRVRSVVVAGAPIYSLQVIVTGIAMDCEKFLRTGTFGPRLGVLPPVQNGTMFSRPAGTVFVNCQVEATGVVLGGLTAFEAVLQGTPDGGDTWVDIGVVNITSDGSQVMLVDGESFISLGAFANMRFQVRDVGAPGGPTTAFEQIQLVMSLDSCDWVIAGGGGSSGGDPVDPSEVFILLAFGPPGPEVADTIPISGQLFDATGAPLAEARKIELILYDTSLAGDIDLALNATFAAVATGTAVEGLTTNRLVVVTDATGLVTVGVLDPAAETVFITGVNPRGPQLIPQLIVQAAQGALTFA